MPAPSRSRFSKDVTGAIRDFRDIGEQCIGEIGGKVGSNVNRRIVLIDVNRIVEPQ